MQNTTTELRRLGISQVEARTGFDRTTLWRKYKAEPPQFPRPHFLGSRRLWFEHEIAAWEVAQMARPPAARHSNLPARGE